MCAASARLRQLTRAKLVPERGQSQVIHQAKVPLALAKHRDSKLDSEFGDGPWSQRQDAQPGLPMCPPGMHRLPALCVLWPLRCPRALEGSGMAIVSFSCPQASSLSHRLAGGHHNLLCQGVRAWQLLVPCTPLPPPTVWAVPPHSSLNPGLGRL